MSIYASESRDARLNLGNNPNSREPRRSLRAAAAALALFVASGCGSEHESQPQSQRVQVQSETTTTKTSPEDTTTTASSVQPEEQAPIEQKPIPTTTIAESTTSTSIESTTPTSKPESESTDPYELLDPATELNQKIVESGYLADAPTGGARVLTEVECGTDQPKWPVLIDNNNRDVFVMDPSDYALFNLDKRGLNFTDDTDGLILDAIEEQKTGNPVPMMDEFRFNVLENFCSGD